MSRLATLGSTSPAAAVPERDAVNAYTSRPAPRETERDPLKVTYFGVHDSQGRSQTMEASGTRCDLSDLCSELEGAKDTEFHKTYPDGPSSRDVLESRDFSALVDLSPMVVGHILLVPKGHYLSFADLIRSGQAAAEVYEEFSDVYREKFGTYVVLEHGSTSDSGSACINHAHLHFLPLEAAPLRDIMERDGLRFTKLTGLVSLASAVPEDAAYYLIASPNEMAVSLSAGMPSQYFRLVIGELLGIPPEECDWAVVVRRSLLFATLQAWKGGTA